MRQAERGGQTICAGLPRHVSRTGLTKDCGVTRNAFPGYGEEAPWSCTHFYYPRSVITWGRLQEFAPHHWSSSSTQSSAVPPRRARIKDRTSALGGIVYKYWPLLPPIHASHPRTNFDLWMVWTKQPHHFSSPTILDHTPFPLPFLLSCIFSNIHHLQTVHLSHLVFYTFLSCLQMSRSARRLMLRTA